MASLTGLYLVVNCHEVAGNAVVVDNVRYVDFTYDSTVLTASDAADEGTVTQDDISFDLQPLDKWTVAWHVVAADLATYRGKSATTLAADAKLSINAYSLAKDGTSAV